VLHSFELALIARVASIDMPGIFFYLSSEMLIKLSAYYLNFISFWNRNYRKQFLHCGRSWFC